MLLGLQAYHDATRGTHRERAVARAEQAVSAMFEEERAWSYVAALYVLLFTDRLDEGIRFVDTTLADVRKRGAVFNFSGMAMTRAIFGYARGTLVEAEADARMALDALPHRGVLFTSHTYGWLAQVLVERGAVDEAADVLREVEDALGGIPDEFAHVPLLRARALVSAARGDHRAALADTLATGRALSAVGHENPAVSYPGWRSEAALAHHALGADDDALALAREEAELARAWGAPRPLGRALRVVGLIEAGDQGIELIREAVSVLEQSPGRLEHAYAVTDLGAALRRGNRRSEARDQLRSGLELAQRCGATRLAERAHEELVAAGARPRRLVMSGVESLTPSERRTAALAAEGLTNKEIALRHPADGRDAPQQRLPQARHRDPHAASSRTCRLGGGPGPRRNNLTEDQTLRLFLRAAPVAGGDARSDPPAMATHTTGDINERDKHVPRFGRGLRPLQRGDRRGDRAAQGRRERRSGSAVEARAGHGPRLGHADRGRRDLRGWLRGGGRMNTPTGHFVRHYIEMVVAMFLGMAVLGTPAMLALGAAGVSSAELHADAPALMLLGMGVTMTVPMVAWMRYRGHGWGPSNEMAASMLIPTAGVIGLLWSGLVTDIGSLLAIEHVVMLPAMLAAMLLRRDEYSGHMHHRAPAGDELAA